MRFLVLLLLIPVSFANSQPVLESIESNNISASVNAFGELFRGGPQSAGFEVPKGSGNHVIFSNGTWMGGQTADGDTHVSALTYTFTDSGELISDFTAGPFATDYSSPYDSLYERLWQISKDAVEAHKNRYNDPNYTMPEVIKNWPARKKPSLGIDHHPAPFVDYNEDGKYDPENGDYPAIRGDTAIFYIINDAGIEQYETQGERLNIEIQAMVYTFSALGDSFLSNTVFVNYNIVNHSGLDYKEVYLGNHTDFDIGSGYDDYIGCDTQRHLYFAYNGENKDRRYGATPPAAGGTFLSTPLNSFVYYKNDFGSQGNPEKPEHYYNYLKGKWKDGEPMRVGNDGKGQTGDTTRYLFYGDPADTEEWSEEGENITVGDRRGIGVAGPFEFDHGESICLDMAFMYARDHSENDTASRLKSVTKLKQRREEIFDFYQQKDYDCPSIGGYSFGTKSEYTNASVRIYPNPAKDVLYWDKAFHRENKEAIKVKLLNVRGQVVKRKETPANNQLNIESLEAGPYIVQIKTEAQVYRQKVLKR